jgi:CRISPR system Cascade subunit CasE
MAFPSSSRKARDAEFLKPFSPDEFGNGQVHVNRNHDSGFLFRIDPLPNGRAMVIVQSAIEPDWGYAFHNATYLLAMAPQVQAFEPRFLKGQRLLFRLAANPTRRLSRHSLDAKEASIGKRVPVPAASLVDWLVRQAEKGGFRVEQDATTFQTGYAYVNKNGSGQRLRSVLFNGLLEVTDADIFRQTVIRGIGSGKAFGFGLLSVTPVNAADSLEAL